MRKKKPKAFLNFKNKISYVVSILSKPNPTKIRFFYFFGAKGVVEGRAFNPKLNCRKSEKHIGIEFRKNDKLKILNVYNCLQYCRVVDKLIIFFEIPQSSSI